MLLLIIFALILTIIILMHLNQKFDMLAGCRRVKTVDGSPLNTKITLLPGKTIFGNNFDVLNATSAKTYKLLRKFKEISKGKSYLMYFLWAPSLSIITAEDAEEVFQSQALITKSVMYNLIVPFLGNGLLISTDELWQFRRKILTPAFHFNILNSFLDIFKEETHRFIDILKQKSANEDVITLLDVIPHFTLNSICETALGVKLDKVPGSELYRKSIKELEPLLVKRVCNPLYYFDWIYWFTKGHGQQKKLLKIIHEFSSKVIQNKREEFQQKRAARHEIEAEVDDFGKKKRYAMLDTLLEAETQGLIDHVGICDEVNTFMFEGYDTTSSCLMFTILNLALHQDVQQKCYEEIQSFSNIDELTLFDFNKLEYLECVIKESLRLYPAVPFFARKTTKETILNGLILPMNTQILIHVVDIMHDERHFPEPLKFKPERFLPEYTTNRHPFAFVPFSAGPRNCIGQKFAMLEIKVLLVAILKNFQILPVTHVEDLTFGNGLVLRTTEKVKVKFILRN